LQESIRRFLTGKKKKVFSKRRTLPKPITRERKTKKTEASTASRFGWERTPTQTLKGGLSRGKGGEGKTCFKKTGGPRKSIFYKGKGRGGNVTEKEAISVRGEGENLVTKKKGTIGAAVQRLA